MRRISTIVLAVAFIALAGFVIGSHVGGTAGSPPSRTAPQLVAATDASGETIDACSLLTESDAKAALGSAVSVTPTSGQCTYVATDGTARALSVAAPASQGNRKDLEAGVEQAASAFGGTSRKISAGDDAYAILSSRAAEGMASAQDHFVVVVLTSPSGSTDQQVSLLTSLLKTAIGRL